MPPHQWPVEPSAGASALLTQVNGAWADNAATYLHWAAEAVQTLHYLTGLDGDVERARWMQAAFSRNTVDLAHARWAVSTAMTALDLCAAAAGFKHGAQSKPDRALDVESLNRAPKRVLLCNGCAAWLDAVLNDPRYEDFKQARDALVHRHLPQHVTVVIGAELSEQPRLGLDISDRGPGTTPPMQIGDIVQLARDIATHHVSEFIVAAAAHIL